MLSKHYCNVFWHNKKLIMYFLIHVMHYILMYSLGPIRKSRETAHCQFVWFWTKTADFTGFLL